MQRYLWASITIGAKHALIGFSDGQKSGRFLTCAGRRLILCRRRFAYRARPYFDCLHASAMKPAPFKYIAATSLEHALSLKGEHGDDAKFLDGGQSLLPAVNFRLARPAILIDINEIAELAGIRRSGGATLVGAVTRYRALQRDDAFART